MKLSLLYTTFPSEQPLEPILKELLEHRLIACANVFGPLTSFYSWEGKIEKSKESAVLLKTTPAKVQATIDALKKLHPYETPAILEIPCGKILPSFAQWAETCIKE